MTRHILIAGPTASGKSALATALAERLDAAVVNADALQVYGCWRVLTARPDADEEARVPHHLYGHVAYRQPYSVGDWLRDMQPLLVANRRLVIVGGAGLYFSALTRGLAQIPETPPDIRAKADEMRGEGGLSILQSYVMHHDPALYARIDRQNPMRLQRAVEVHLATGKPLSDWQDETTAPLLPLADTCPVVLATDRDVLAQRIEARFDRMMEAGALDEVAALRDGWDPKFPASRALGASELLSVLEGKIDMESAVKKAKIASRRYAKRQRTWFRSNMADWHWLQADHANLAERVLGL